MNWKQEAISKLRAYEARKRSAENIPIELVRLKSAYESVRGASASSEPVSGGGSRQEDMMLSNIAHRQELVRTLKQAQMWVKMVDNAMDVLDDDERLILDRLYIHRAKGNVNRLCEELSAEQSTIYRRRDKALRQFTIALYGIIEN